MVQSIYSDAWSLNPERYIMFLGAAGVATAQCGTRFSGPDPAAVLHRMASEYFSMAQISFFF